ncbi:MAG: DUF5666 domain-containing protein [Candidatus Adlerbacteria bacterium]|nr:DUF5666 domain-containing protein [Candidatus Adlerbacteria bacterium]
MKKINYYLATSTVALALIAVAAPALASANEGSKHASVQTGARASLHIGGDKDKNHDTDKKTRRAEGTKNFLAAIGAAGAGVVTSVNGSTVTLKSFGTKATTTVTTNASTVYKVNGQATTSAAVAAGSHVIVTGTTNADTSITASIISIFTGWFGFFKHLFR